MSKAPEKSHLVPGRGWARKSCAGDVWISWVPAGGAAHSVTPSPVPEHTLGVVLGRGDALFAALTLGQDRGIPWDTMQGGRTTQTLLPMYDVPVADRRVVPTRRAHAQTCTD